MLQSCLARGGRNSAVRAIWCGRRVPFRRRDAYISLCTVRVLVGLLRQTVTLHSIRLLLRYLCTSISLYTYLMLQVPGATLGPGFPDHLTT